MHTTVCDTIRTSRISQLSGVNLKSTLRLPPIYEYARTVPSNYPDTLKVHMTLSLEPIRVRRTLQGNVRASFLSLIGTFYVWGYIHELRFHFNARDLPGDYM